MSGGKKKIRKQQLNEDKVTGQHVWTVFQQGAGPVGLCSWISTFHRNCLAGGRSSLAQLMTAQKLFYFANAALNAGRGYNGEQQITQECIHNYLDED